ncbi:ABC-type transport system substrate-binding protein [Rhizobium mongolense]
MAAPSHRYLETVRSIPTTKTPAGTKKAKQLFKEAGYSGEKVVILQPTDFASLSNAALAAKLREIRVNAELAPSDWGGVAKRRSSKGLVESGGWSIFITSDSDYLQGDPTTAIFLNASGEKAWFGWPKNDEYEALRAKWPDVETLEERKELARRCNEFGGTSSATSGWVKLSHHSREARRSPG